jgi:hypothetical protein
MNVGDPVINRVGVPSTGLTSPHFCTCPKSGPGFQTSYVVVYVINGIYIYILWERRLKMNLSSISYVNRIVTVSKQIV